MTTTALPDLTREERRSVRIRWVLVGFLLLGGIVNYLDRSALSVANTTIAEEFGLDPLEMGLLLAAFSWPYALANLPAGYLVDRLGPRRMFAGAATAWSLVAVVTAAAQSFGVLYACRVALGIAEAPFFTSALAVNQRWFRSSERALPIALVNTGSQIANAIAPPLLTVLLLTLSWRGMFVVVGATGIVVALVWLRIYRDPTLAQRAVLAGLSTAPTTGPEPVAAAAAGASDPASGASAESARAGWTRLLRQPNTWFMVLGAFGIFYTSWVYLTWLPSYLQTARGFSLTNVGWLAAVPFLCGVAGVLVGGAVSNLLILRGAPTLTARRIPIVGGAVLAAAAVLPVAFVDDTAVAIGLLSLGYFAAQVPVGCLWTLAADIAPPAQVASLGAIQNFGGFLGAALAPVVTGAILNATGGSYAWVFVVGGVLLLVGAVAYGVFVRDRSAAESPGADA
ncbi:MFS transporter [Microbacterium sp. HMH0099]|uniref:MFS transporter n=1 Tax=Microbacterium sp. HMH0099 TaxID=3414026 RepID=UPI003BF6513B